MMQVRVLQSTLVNGVWHEPGVGNYEPNLANHLIDLGVAEPYKTKTVEPAVKKSVAPSSASQPGQASQKPIAKRSKEKRKLSQ